MKYQTFFILFLTASFVDCGENMRQKADSYCPPKDLFHLHPSFNVSLFVGTWYIQRAQDSLMTPLPLHYCMRYTWRHNTPTQYVVARETSIHGTTHEEEGYIVEHSGSKMKVGLEPGVSPLIASQPLWVLSASKSLSAAKGYLWAILIAGAPVLESNKKCVTNGATGGGGSDLGNVGKGLLYITREQILDKEVILEMDKETQGKGVDTSVLRIVEQKGCVYEDD